MAVVSWDHEEKVVLDLEVMVSTESVVEGRFMDIASDLQLSRHPVLIPVVVTVYEDMAHLSHPNEPVTLQEPYNGVEAQEPLRPSKDK